ncbi:hypothetical protein OF117_04415 [Geodermatophilus sp. YIM 151500]|uniref:hypothetical protein n=1 Tax=Geodermatophilus sp. YIM 151500 TaxID=2984531 RepID=UPI0021E3DE82|nr:hypothetical protein [Geodermatophilus sp. YIM 151500]MCV2488599.1 hypothetical protein [Geodermatophilus sp. YIM 151500]
MDAAAWVLLGGALGALLTGAVVLLAGIAGRRPGPGSRGGPASRPGWADDDLPAFLASPPGATPSVEPAADAAWVPLGPLVPAPPAEEPRPRPERTAARVLTATTAVAAVLGVGSAVAAVVPAGAGSPGSTSAAGSGADAGGPDDRTALPEVPADPAPGDPGAGDLAARSVPVGPDGVLVRMSFGGIVLEERAVGVTVAYPSLGLTATEVPGAALAHVRLPLFNCLGDTAPADPVAAGCRRAPTEYAELTAPALAVGRDGAGDLRVEGRFPTYRRPNGSPPQWTGRSYPFRITVTASGAGGGSGADGGPVPATGTLHLGTARAGSAGPPGADVLVPGG